MTRRERARALLVEVLLLAEPGVAPALVDRIDEARRLIDLDVAMDRQLDAEVAEVLADELVERVARSAP